MIADNPLSFQLLFGFEFGDFVASNSPFDGNLRESKRLHPGLIANKGDLLNRLALIINAVRGSATLLLLVFDLLHEGNELFAFAFHLFTWFGFIFAG